MKPSVLLLSLFLLGAGSAFAQKQAAPKKPSSAAATKPQSGPNMLSCTIDGKAYTATGSQFRSYAKLKSSENPPYQLIHIFNNPTSSPHYALRFYIAPGTTLAPGTYTAGDLYTEDAQFPNVAFDVTETKGTDARAFESQADGTGTVTITSVAGGMIEGTFAFNLEGMAGKRTVTNGSFQFKMPVVEKK